MAIGEGVGLDPAPTSIAEKVLTGIHRPVQRAEDGASDRDAGFRQARGRRPWRWESQVQLLHLGAVSRTREHPAPQ